MKGGNILTYRDVYCYGTIAHTFAFMLGSFPVPDEYSEISRKWDYFGGETGTCAAVLSSLGVSVKLDGNHISGREEEAFRKYFSERKADISSVTFDPEFEGLSDYVIITGNDRTAMGSYGHFYSEAHSSGNFRWNKPSEDDIKTCCIAAIDPVMDCDRAAEYCIKHGKPYVTVDCGYDSFVHKNAAISVISGESLKSSCPGNPPEEMLSLYCENSPGLTVITNGSGKFCYGRKGKSPEYFDPYKVKTVSTLGAGDTFKAGCVYALLHEMSDKETVSFAAACAAEAVSVCPLHLNLPRLENIRALQKSRHDQNSSFIKRNINK